MSQKSPRKRNSPRKSEYSYFDSDLNKVEKNEVLRFKSQECEICDETFNSYEGLTNHMKSLHKYDLEFNPNFDHFNNEPLSKSKKTSAKTQTFELDSEEDCSDLEQGEVPLRKLKQVSMEDPLAENVRTPVKIAFTAKSKIKDEEIEIEEHPIEPIEQNEESGTGTMNSFLGDSKLFHCEFCSESFSTITSLNMHKTWHKTNSHSPNMTNEKIVRVSLVDAAKENDEKIKKIYGLIKEVENEKATASKRTFDQIGESGQSISPKRIKLVQIPSTTLPKNQTIIKGPKKVLRVLLKKTQTSETPSSFSTNNIEAFEEEKTTSIALGDDHDYTISKTTANKSNVEGEYQNLRLG